MTGESIQCCGCGELVRELKAYNLIYRPKENPSEVQIYSGHRYCLVGFEQKLKQEAMQVSKILLVRPAAYNPYDPLYIGYVGGTASGE